MYLASYDEFILRDSSKGGSGLPVCHAGQMRVGGYPIKSNTNKKTTTEIRVLIFDRRYEFAREIRKVAQGRQ